MGTENKGSYRRLAVDGAFVAAAAVRNPIRRLLTTTVSPLAMVEEALAGSDSMLNLTRILIGRSNTARAVALRQYLDSRRIPYQREIFRQWGRSGENFIVSMGVGAKRLIVLAHHDAMIGSPGANDNASSVAVLLSLIAKSVPSTELTVEIVFTGQEENGLLGALGYLEAHPAKENIVGVISLELCGIGDAVVIADAIEDSAFLECVKRGFESCGFQAEADYFIEGRIPLLRSDHRPFVEIGVPGLVMTVIPRKNAEFLRDLVRHPIRALPRLAKKGLPAPFDTYHRASDRYETLDPSALALAERALGGIIQSVEQM